MLETYGNDWDKLFSAAVLKDGVYVLRRTADAQKDKNEKAALGRFEGQREGQ
jgi:hypothetical protein